MITDEEIAMFLATVMSHDFDVPIPRCLAVMREAERRGLVMRRPAVLAAASDRAGEDRKFPVAVTVKGEWFMKNRRYW